MQNNTISSVNPTAMIRRKRKIKGISAILLPFRANGDIDWPGLASPCAAHR